MTNRHIVQMKTLRLIESYNELTKIVGCFQLVKVDILYLKWTFSAKMSKYFLNIFNILHCIFATFMFYVMKGKIVTSI